MKQYDRAYFDQWYRGADGVRTRAALERRVRLAVAVAEYALERPLRSVLDVGCGEGEWLRVVRTVRPNARYVGIDPSEYAVRRYGLARGIRRGDFAALGVMALDGPFDLVVCADVLHYVPDADLELGLPALAALVGGVAYLEIFTRADAVEGDLRGFRRRPPEFYTSRFVHAGLTPLGLHCWAGPSLGGAFAALERGDQRMDARPRARGR